MEWHRPTGLEGGQRRGRRLGMVGHAGGAGSRRCVCRGRARRRLQFPEMIGFLLKFLGVKVGEAQEVTSVSLQLRQGSWLGWAVSLALLLAVFGWWVYRHLGAHRDLARRPRGFLTAVRVALYLLILFMLLRPVFSFTVENRIRRTLIALIDQSSSMDIQDARLADPDLKRAAIAKGMIQRIDQSLSKEHATEVEHLARQ